MKKLLLAVLVLAALARPAAAAGASHDALAGSPVYSDQAFQDFVETAYGYKGPAGDALRAPVYRDAVAAPAAPAAAYVYVSILPRLAGGAALAAELERSAGFILTGRRYLVSGGIRRVRLQGWVKAGAVEALRANPGVAGLRVGFGKPRTAAL